MCHFCMSTGKGQVPFKEKGTEGGGRVVTNLLRSRTADRRSRVPERRRMRRNSLIQYESW